MPPTKKEPVLVKLSPAQFETLLILVGREESRLGLTVARAHKWIEQAKQDLGRDAEVRRYKINNAKHNRMRSLQNALIKVKTKP